MGKSINVPDSHSEVARFTRLDSAPIPAEGMVALQISFFRGYIAGRTSHFIGCVYVDAEGGESFWSRAYNGRNEPDWEAELTNAETDTDYERKALPELAMKRDWLKS